MKSAISEAEGSPVVVALTAFLVDAVGEAGFGGGHPVSVVLVEFALPSCNPLVRGGCVTLFSHVVFGCAEQVICCVGDSFQAVVQ